MVAKPMLSHSWWMLALRGVSALVTGVLDSVLAVRLRGHARRGVWLLLASGIAAIVFGTILIALPTVGALALVWLMGGYAVVAGILYMVLAFRSYEKEPTRAAANQPENIAPRTAAWEEGGSATEGAWTTRAVPPTTMRAGAVRKAAANDRRVGERRMTPAGQH